MHKTEYAARKRPFLLTRTAQAPCLSDAFAVGVVIFGCLGFCCLADRDDAAEDGRPGLSVAFDQAERLQVLRLRQHQRPPRVSHEEESPKLERSPSF